LFEVEAEGDQVAAAGCATGKAAGAAVHLAQRDQIQAHAAQAQFQIDFVGRRQAAAIAAA